MESEPGINSEISGSEASQPAPVGDDVSEVIRQSEADVATTETFAESNLARDLAAEAARLSQESGVSEATALEEVMEAADKLLPDATVQQFIPLLAGRRAKEHLEATLAEDDDSTEGAEKS